MTAAERTAVEKEREKEKELQRRQLERKERMNNYRREREIQREKEGDKEKERQRRQLERYERMQLERYERMNHHNHHNHNYDNHHNHQREREIQREKERDKEKERERRQLERYERMQLERYERMNHEREYDHNHHNHNHHNHHNHQREREIQREYERESEILEQIKRVEKRKKERDDQARDSMAAVKERVSQKKERERREERRERREERGERRGERGEGRGERRGEERKEGEEGRRGEERRGEERRGEERNNNSNYNNNNNNRYNWRNLPIERGEMGRVRVSRDNQSFIFSPSYIEVERDLIIDLRVEMRNGSFLYHYSVSKLFIENILWGSYRKELFYETYYDSKDFKLMQHGYYLVEIRYPSDPENHICWVLKSASPNYSLNLSYEEDVTKEAMDYDWSLTLTPFCFLDVYKLQKKEGEKCWYEFVNVVGENKNFATLVSKMPTQENHPPFAPSILAFLAGDPSFDSVLHRLDDGDKKKLIQNRVAKMARPSYVQIARRHLPPGLLAA